MKQISIIAFLLFSRFTDKPFCTCAPKSVQQKVSSAEMIFSGEAVSIDTLFTVETSLSFENDGSKKEHLRPVELTRTKFKVDKMIKGQASSEYISVYTTSRCCTCGSSFFQKSKFIVFTNSTTIPISKEKDITWDMEKLGRIKQDTIKVFWTSMCHGTDEYSSQLLDEIVKIQRSARSR